MCELTPYMIFAHNTLYHSSTTFSPFYLLNLREARIPIDLAIESVGETVPADWDDYVTEMRNRMEQAFQAVRYLLGQAFQRANQAYDRRVKTLQFKVDDLVWFFCPQETVSSGTEVAIVNHGTLAN